MTGREIIQQAEQALHTLYDPREAHNIALQIAAECMEKSISATLADLGATSPCDETTIECVIRNLAAGVPIQQFLGYTEFFGRRFEVTADVLIPRPETEELVDWIRRDEHAAHRLLDVGTGSGCIAISLDLELPHVQISAIDISEKALAVAARNNRKLGASVELGKADALNSLETAFDTPFDVIVSNPPYIPQSDRATMHINVRDYEPALALFVPDDDPIRFYRAIARAGQVLLREGGRLYFEIYSNSAEAICNMLMAQHYTQITLRNDLQGKPRMICCRKK